jgi:hypothetical protein
VSVSGEPTDSVALATRASLRLCFVNERLRSVAWKGSESLTAAHDYRDRLAAAMY